MNFSVSVIFLFNLSSNLCNCHSCIQTLEASVQLLCSYSSEHHPITSLDQITTTVTSSLIHYFLLHVSVSRLLQICSIAHNICVNAIRSLWISREGFHKHRLEAIEEPTNKRALEYHQSGLWLWGTHAKATAMANQRANHITIST